MLAQLFIFATSFAIANCQISNFGMKGINLSDIARAGQEAKKCDDIYNAWVNIGTSGNDAIKHRQELEECKAKIGISWSTVSGIISKVEQSKTTNSSKIQPFNQSLINSAKTNFIRNISNFSPEIPWRWAPVK
eukprot:1010902_1